MEPTSDSRAEIALLNSDLYVLDSATRRILGAFDTPQSAADYMAAWAVRHDGEHILEPSFGDGVFLRAVAERAAHAGWESVHLSGIEIDEKARVRALQERLIAGDDVRFEDFLCVPPFEVQAVIGNPPYVRLRHLASSQRAKALEAAEAAMGQSIDPSASLWMPFVLHAMRFLARGGRLAFVLPYDFTYVRYARPLWAELRANFGSLHVLRTHERVFEGLLQDVVILFADDYGARTDTVHYQAFERVSDLLCGRSVIDESLSIDELLHGERVFIEALLGDELRQLLRTRVRRATVQARRLVTFNIGYVTGDKRFFHPTPAEAEEYQLPKSSLRRAVTSSRTIRGVGLRTSSLGDSRASFLFLPDSNALTPGEQRYIELGKERGILQRYKCRIRDPWFVVPGVRVPDVVLSVFTELPVLLINDAQDLASNSLLCGFSLGSTGDEIATAWYTSLTLLQCELEVHALGGGVMVIVPREAGNIRLPNHVQVHQDHLHKLDALLLKGKTKEAYESGDHQVLVSQLGLNPSEVAVIRSGIEVLAHWRTSARTSKA
jgi:adenine-specific DNA-methyltransferase